MRGLLAAALFFTLLLAGCEQQAVKVGPSLVAFSATWCLPCQRDKPLLAEIKAQFPVTEIDIDAQPGEAARFGVRTVPYYFVVNDGVTVGTGDIRRAFELLRSLDETRQ